MKRNLTKIHFHSDNIIFGGSEKMLSCILNYKKLRIYIRFLLVAYTQTYY
jgi:hypothetical protein